MILSIHGHHMVFMVINCLTKDVAYTHVPVERSDQHHTMKAAVKRNLQVCAQMQSQGEARYPQGAYMNAPARLPN